LGKQEKFNFLK